MTLRNPWLLSVLVLSIGLCPAVAAKQPPSSKPDGSLSDLDLGFSEVKLTLEKVLDENVQLREQLAVAGASRLKLEESVAVANSEAEVFRRQAGELKLRLEALGLDTAGGNTGKLEQRLLKAANNLRLVEEEKSRLAERLAGLSEAVLRYVKSTTSDDAEARLVVETQLRAANQALGGTKNSVEASAVASTLTDGMVISIKEELALVVANLGLNHGVKIGMPFEVLRGDQALGVVRIVDVREKIAGAVIQNLSSEKDKIKIGDRLRVSAQP